MGCPQSIHRVLSHLDIRAAFHPFWTLAQELVHPNNPVPELLRNGVVYTILCDQCLRCYVGQSGRSLEQRLREHRRTLRKGGCWPRRLLNICLHRATRWTCPRPGLWILTLTTRPGVCWSPGTLNAGRPLSTEG